MDGMDGRDLVHTVVAAGSFAVSLMCIYLGDRLLLVGATGGFKFADSVGGGPVGIQSVAPGSALIAFGMVMAVLSLLKLVDGPRRCLLAGPLRS